MSILAFDLSCMVSIEVGIVYNKTMKGTIMKTPQVDRGE